MIAGVSNSARTRDGLLIVVLFCVASIFGAAAAWEPRLFVVAFVVTVGTVLIDFLPEIQKSPLWGNGFGYAYKPINTGRALSDKSENLQCYAHNFYLWLLVKAGPVGFLLFLVPIARVLVAALRGSGHVALTTGALAAGLLAVSFVAPMPLGSPTAVLLGLVTGACAGSIPVYGRNGSRWTRNGMSQSRDFEKTNNVRVQTI